jgi:predicted acylesterase/phospholipase RssA
MRELTLGLALGAGGTKGAAHVGVMQVLEEAGIVPAVVAGTSIGALYGGTFAVGRTAAEMAQGIRDCPPHDVGALFRQRLKLRANNRLARRFYEALAGHNIENLPLKFAATASDIAAKSRVHITRGPLIDAIEASIAIPIIARPVAHQGMHLLDGGFWEHAPVDAAVELGADVVVAVHLGRPLSLPARLHVPANGLARAIDRVPLARTFAGLPFTIHAISTPMAAGRTAQVILRPRLRRSIFGMSPFLMTSYLDAGIESAREALPAIRALLAGEEPQAVMEELVPAPSLALEPGV